MKALLFLVMAMICTLSAEYEDATQLKGRLEAKSDQQNFD